MKRIIVSVAIVLTIILMTLTLQSCFTPYPAAGDSSTSNPKTVSFGSDCGEIWNDVVDGVPSIGKPNLA